jgi:signal transduction histidine kinase
LVTDREQLSKAIKDIAMGIRWLRDATAIRIEELRNYVHQLAQTGTQESCLLPSVRRFAARFSTATGITVRIEAECEPRISDRLAAELFQMVVEGLSNIQRHTHSSYATIKLTCSNKNNQIYLHIENDSKEEKAKPFTPRSLLERVSSLGGRLRVEQHEGSHTTVSIEIPL